MTDERRKSSGPGEDKRRTPNHPSKGQYGGLKGLGPGGGRDIEEATDTDDIGRDEVEATKP